MKAFRKLSRRFRGIPSKDKENYAVPEGAQEKARKAKRATHARSVRPQVRHLRDAGEVFTPGWERQLRVLKYLSNLAYAQSRRLERYTYESEERARDAGCGVGADAAAGKHAGGSLWDAGGGSEEAVIRELVEKGKIMLLLRMYVEAAIYYRENSHDWEGAVCCKHAETCLPPPPDASSSEDEDDMESLYTSSSSESEGGGG